MFNLLITVLGVVAVVILCVIDQGLESSCPVSLGSCGAPEYKTSPEKT